MSLHRILLVLIAAVLLAALVPAGLLMERRLARAIETQTREDLVVARHVLADRRTAAADALMMHAKELATTGGLADALSRGDSARATRIVEQARGSFGDAALLITARGVSWTGPAIGESLVEQTREGQMPVDVVSAPQGLVSVALAPVEEGSRWIGAAGIAVDFGQAEAGALAGLTRSDVVLLDPAGRVVASTARPLEDSVVARVAPSLRGDTTVWEEHANGTRYVMTSALPGTAGQVVFVRDLAREMAVLPELRRIAGVSFAVALAFALLLGAIFAGILVRPVRALATAADHLAAGDFQAPLLRSQVTEVSRVADAFDAMRQALAARLEELEIANRELELRQARLSALQSELIQRDRLAAAGHLVTQLAHEIRNPVANVRNCLELIRRQLEHDTEAREYADLAIDELLRMHELAEQMLDLHRPREGQTGDAPVLEVAREIATLTTLGADDDALQVRAEGDREAVARIAPEALKQVLLNLVRNAREAMHDQGIIEITAARDGDRIHIAVIDQGPGLSTDVFPHIFDPFFTTKGVVQGVGLGLFVAEGIIRGAGGRITAANRQPGPGAVFRIELPAAEPAAARAAAVVTPATRESVT